MAKKKKKEEEEGDLKWTNMVLLISIKGMILEITEVVFMLVNGILKTTKAVYP